MNPQVPSFNSGRFPESETLDDRNPDLLFPLLAGMIDTSSGFRSEELCQRPAPPFDPLFGRPELLKEIAPHLQSRRKH